MDFGAIMKRVIAILTNPKAEFEVIKNEPMTVGDIFTKYAMILAAIPVIATFIGTSLIGSTYGAFGFSVTYRVPVVQGIITAILMYAVGLAGLYLSAFIVDALAPTFNCKNDIVQSLKLVAFSNTPVWIAGVLNILPSLAMLSLIGGLYAFYMFYIGLPIFKEVAADKHIGYLILVIVASIVIYVAIGFLITSVIIGAFFSVGPVVPHL